MAGGSFSSGNFASGSFSHTFNAPGSYTFICTLHSGMTGTIDVTDAPTLAVPEAPALAVAASVVAAIAGMLLWSRRGASRRVGSGANVLTRASSAGGLVPSRSVR